MKNYFNRKSVEVQRWTPLEIMLNGFSGGEGRYIFGNWEKRMGNTYGTQHACVVIARVPSTRAAFVCFPGNFPNPICFDRSDLFRKFVWLNKCKKNKAWRITLLKIWSTDLSALWLCYHEIHTWSWTDLSLLVSWLVYHEARLGLRKKTEHKMIVWAEIYKQTRL